VKEIWNEAAALWPLVLFACTYLFGIRPLRAMIREQLADPASRRQYSAELRQERFLPGLDGRRYGEQDYRRRLRKVLIEIDRTFGKNLLLSPRGFLICVGCALVYSSLFLLLGWLVGMGAATGSLDVLPSEWEWWRRSLLVLMLAVETVITCRLSLTAFRKRSWLAKSTCWAMVCVVAYAATVVALAFTTYEFRLFRASMDHHAFAILLLTYVAALLGCLTAGILGRAQTWVLLTLIVVTVGLSLAGVVADAFYHTHHQFVILFMVALPLANALFDWPSWAISRRLMAALAARPATLGRLTGHTLLDLEIGRAHV